MEIESISSGEMAVIDREVPGEYGVTASRMMENAAYQIADFVRRELANPGKLVVYAGKGNNGGDGLAAARRLHNWGFEVEAVCPFGLDGIRREELEILRKLDVPVFEESRPAEIAVDALIGYNLEGSPRPPFDSLIDAVNRAGRVVSVDVPSGIDADTGRKYRPYVEADYVVTLGLPKHGLEDFDAEVWLADISIPDRAYELVGVELEGLFSDGSLKRVK